MGKNGISGNPEIRISGIAITSHSCSTSAEMRDRNCFIRWRIAANIPRQLPQFQRLYTSMLILFVGVVVSPMRNGNALNASTPPPKTKSTGRLCGGVGSCVVTHGQRPRPHNTYAYKRPRNFVGKLSCCAFYITSTHKP